MVSQATEDFFKQVADDVRGKNKPATTEEEAKLARDRHVMEIAGNDPSCGRPNNSMENAENFLGVSNENWARIRGKKLKDSIKEVFNSKMALAQKFYDKQPIYLDDSGSFWLWDFDIKAWYRVEREEDIANLIYEALKCDTINAKERNEIFQALKQIGRLNKPEDMPNTWIQFKNGIIDITQEGIIFDSTPEYFTVNPIPWNIGKSDATPTMDAIFEQWVGKDHVKTLYQIIAYCMLSDYPLHRLFCFIGGGMNGKSKFLELLRKFIGEENCCSTELDILLNSRFEITRLYKKLICQMGETNFSEMNKTSQLKKLTGGDMIGFEFKNKSPFEARNYAKILISTNNLPTTSDKTDGFYRRWMIIDFPNQFSEAKDILADIPNQEYENLAYKCIRILRNLLQAREFHGDGDLDQRRKRFEEHSDPLEKFLKENTVEDADARIWKFEFEKRLNAWCKENRFRTLSEETIGRKMKEKGITQALYHSDWLIDGQKKKLRAWVGINWKFSLPKPIEQAEQEKQVGTTRYTPMETNSGLGDLPVPPVPESSEVRVNYKEEQTEKGV